MVSHVKFLVFRIDHYSSCGKRTKYCINVHFYRPQMKFAKVMFLQVSVCPQGGMCGCSGGACMVAPGGCVWLLPGGHAWLLPGGHAWLFPGGAWLLQGGVHGCSWGVCMVAHGGHAWLLWGACMVALGGHVWLLMGGMCGCSWGGMRSCSWGACMVAPGGVHGFFDEIRSMSGRYTSYWNAFLLSKFYTHFQHYVNYMHNNY